MNDELYKQHILDHAQRPRNFGPLTGATHTGLGTNPSCGDSLTLFLIIRNKTVREVRFEGHGCAISQAAASMLTEKLAGLEVDQLLLLSEADIYALLQVPISSEREKCALLPLRALEHALR